MKEKLTVFFDEPFWVGVFERYDNGKLSVCKVTFGAEPKEQEVYAFILGHYNALRFSREVDIWQRKAADNPKRRQRNARKQIEQSGIGTRSQRALQMQLEQNKQERKVKKREQKLADKQRMFEIKQQKKKEKHRGR
ncbi:MAG: YjdF family protein [Firmicutes bacterium]|nr:YjdF family protein [Bacillota bacterium]